jgi:XTP/dITP diphosphohydrolase
VGDIRHGSTADAGTAMPARETTRLDELIETVALQRAPGGCPWDADQTHASLVQYLVEESWELIDAIESGDRDEMIEELGDVLYQVLFHADIAAHTAGEDFDI